MYDEAREYERNIGAGLFHLLHSPQLPPIEPIVTTLLHEMTAIPTRFVLVLDDYHLIKAGQIDEAITLLLEHMPPQMHLVISTREEPRLPVARLRVRNQLTEVRASDLRFTYSETAEFSGSHHLILDYLVEEVLIQQSASIQAFLLHTSILDRLSSPLCDAVFGQSDICSSSGQETLEFLERANLFIVPLDSERRWYRYYHLFARCHTRNIGCEQAGGMSMREWYVRNTDRPMFWS